jgi:DNA-binding CsgD family transcriptional regulator
MQMVDFEAHDTYALGDTHLTPRQLADVRGCDVSTVSYHINDGQLSECTRVRIAGAAGNGCAVEYDAAVHAFVTGGTREHTPVDRGRVLALAREYAGWRKADAVARIAEETGRPRGTIYRILREGAAGCLHGDDRTRAAYQRQQRAQALHADGMSRAEIQEQMGISRTTLWKYLSGAFDAPEE